MILKILIYLWSNERIDDDECALKTDTCGILGPDWVCRNTLGSFRCEKKRCTGPSCKVQGSATGGMHNALPTAVKCLRGYETDKNNKCVGNAIGNVYITLHTTVRNRSNSATGRRSFLSSLPISILSSIKNNIIDRFDPYAIR